MADKAAAEGVALLVGGGVALVVGIVAVGGVFDIAAGGLAGGGRCRGVSVAIPIGVGVSNDRIDQAIIIQIDEFITIVVDVVANFVRGGMDQGVLIVAIVTVIGELILIAGIHRTVDAIAQ